MSDDIGLHKIGKTTIERLAMMNSLTGVHYRPYFDLM